MFAILLSALFAAAVVPSSPYALMGAVRIGLVIDIPGSVAFTTAYIFGLLYAAIWLHAITLDKALGGR